MFPVEVNPYKRMIVLSLAIVWLFGYAPNRLVVPLNAPASFGYHMYPTCSDRSSVASAPASSSEGVIPLESTLIIRPVFDPWAGCEVGCVSHSPAGIIETSTTPVNLANVPLNDGRFNRSIELVTYLSHQVSLLSLIP